jgi:hypothetical protein
VGDLLQPIASAHNATAAVVAFDNSVIPRMMPPQRMNARTLRQTGNALEGSL